MTCTNLTFKYATPRKRECVNAWLRMLQQHAEVNLERPAWINLSWSEAVMRFPDGWSALEQLETPKILCWLQSLLIS